MRSKGKATSLDIAYLAGVSQPTVSRTLRGSPTVNEETRQRILAIARELNYKVDKNTSNLRFQHSGTLALLFFEDPTLDDSLINPFFLSMLGSLTRACVVQGYDLLISFQEMSGNWQADYEDSKKADGIILLGYGDYLEYTLRLEKLVEQGTHFIRWGAVGELLERNVPFDALFCASALIAIGAMRALQDRGIRVPEDVAVAGFDDIPMASFANPSLTTVQQDTKVAATLLVESLLALIHGEPVQSQTIPATLAVRQSTEHPHSSLSAAPPAPL